MGQAGLLPIKYFVSYPGGSLLITELLVCAERFNYLAFSASHCLNCVVQATHTDHDTLASAIAANRKAMCQWTRSLISPTSMHKTLAS